MVYALKSCLRGESVRDHMDMAEPTEENIEKARTKQLVCPLPYLGHNNDNDTSKVVEEGMHPITCTADRYCLVDEFHKDNHKNPKDMLRHLSLVPEIRGKINSQVAEQLFNHLKRDIYYLNSNNGAHYMFLLRLLLHLRNEDINKESSTSTADSLKTWLPKSKTEIGKDGHIVASIGESNGTVRG